ncbi:aminotransferase [Sphingomonas sp. Leaf407]|uniref:cysteine desulfurase family protein n=1 Tax=unclassified Sphingomonas TaxID=196159 RepID=UPI0006F441BA|nr:MULTISPECIES: cysteine desulfurase family protein [unclassified Sphingomonas]KQN36971.1 aminotransferase [Sphingomonas sp. Leaf42]KQT30398.1 aminotransferase [Sphingomonas sp. Leaf407]
MTYLDYQATTPLAPEAFEAMVPWLRDFHANPHSPHREGRRAKAAVEVARDQVLGALGGDAAAGRLFFTGGATEAANWAIAGTFAKAGRPKVVMIATEHACVLDSCRAVGAEVVVLPVGRDGLVDRAAALAAIDGRTALVAAMLVNNEIGVVQPIAWLGGLARAAGAVMVCDAVQGFGRVPLPVDACDLIAVSAHKVHGPKGIGALWVRAGAEPAAILHGGGQEGGLRSGTLSPALCAGFGAAAALLKDDDPAQVEGLWRAARDVLGPEWVLNGAANARYRGNLNVRMEGLDVARLMSECRTLAFSAGSACASGSGRSSHVLRAMGLTEREARSSIRIGFGRYTSEEELVMALETIDLAARSQW